MRGKERKKTINKEKIHKYRKKDRKKERRIYRPTDR